MIWPTPVVAWPLMMMEFLAFAPRLVPEKAMAEVVALVRATPFTLLRLSVPKVRVCVPEVKAFVWVTFKVPRRRSSAPMTSLYDVTAAAVLVTVTLPP